MKKSEKTSSKNKNREVNSVKLVVAIVILIVLAGLATILIDHISSKPSTKTSTNTSTSTAPAIVNITSKGFSPATISAKVGQSIVWTNKDSKTHEVASDPYPTDNTVPGFKSKKMVTGDTYTFVFTKAGTYTYHDDLYPKVLGTIVVQ